MKLILVALTLTFWIHSFPGYTQPTEENQSEAVYCLPISKARLLIADALRLRLADSIYNNRSARIAVLEREKESDRLAYANLLKISEDKFKEQKAISADFQKHSQSFSDQLSYYEKINRKQKRQNTGLKILLGVSAGFIVYQSIK